MIDVVLYIVYILMGIGAMLLALVLNHVTGISVEAFLILFIYLLLESISSKLTGRE